MADRVALWPACRTGHDAEGPERVELEVGNSLESYDPEDPGDQGDQHPKERLDYLLVNPPFGVEWKQVADSVQNEHESLGSGLAGSFT